jgi:hypothetical protein
MPLYSVASGLDLLAIPFLRISTNAAFACEKLVVVGG